MTRGAALSAAPPATDERADRALARLLDDLASVLLQLSADVYIAKPLPHVSGSIGEHVRHILDHVAAFVTAHPHGTLSYDARERGTSVETDIGAALRTIMRLKAIVGEATDDDFAAPVTVSSIVGRHEPPVRARSTLRRELVFVINHTIHHQALIAILLALLGVDTPDAFGVAPSTPAFARS
jgi:uncharacterized damage-inducible protein DinB